MSIEEILLIITTVSTLCGGGIKWVWSAVSKKHKDSIDNLRAICDQLQTKFDDCEHERAEMDRRLTALESSLNHEAATWRRTHDGIVISASPEFVRLFCAPHGYTMSDVVGARFEELDAFSSDLIEALAEMDAEVLRRGHAARSNVPLGAGTLATIIKVASRSSTGDVVFIGYAADQEHLEVMPAAA